LRAEPGSCHERLWRHGRDLTFTLQITCLVYAFMGNSKQMSYGPETVAAMLVGTPS